MTDEFHGHLGVFSIVGAKMGIRAREIFGVGPDMLNVVTYAGTSLHTVASMMVYR